MEQLEIILFPIIKLFWKHSAELVLGPPISVVEKMKAVSCVDSNNDLGENHDSRYNLTFHFTIFLLFILRKSFRNVINFIVG